jgi:hypothetical protein
MAKLCATGRFFKDILKSKIPDNYFLPNGISSFKVRPLSYGQIREEFLEYNRIITIPLVNPRLFNQVGNFDQPYLFIPKKYTIEINLENANTGVISVCAPDFNIGSEEELKRRRNARLVALDSFIFHDVYKSGRLLESRLSNESYDFELLRFDMPKEKLFEILEHKKSAKSDILPALKGEASI